MKPGGTYLDVPAELRRYRSDIFEDKYFRLSENEVSRTITAHIAKDGYWYIHPTQNRTLSIREAARIQTFPDRFRFAGHQTNRFRQIGNAVPPLLGSAIASSVLQSIENANRQENSPIGNGNDKTSSQFLRRDLARWFKKNDRKFPWRQPSLNTWQVLLIEMCLHRTKADQVAEVAQEILELGSTPEQFLTNARTLSPKIATLGLHWRAENLIQAARFIRDNLDGMVPESWQELRVIPGVGDYIASAVLCFGKKRPTVLIDTNTTRIARRVLGTHSESPTWRLRLSLLTMAGSKGPDQEWNYGLLDLGALVCTARSPKCSVCPIQQHCSTGTSRLRSVA
jgi:DNA (cytosine-5)-methyltransferase 1